MNSKNFINIEDMDKIPQNTIEILEKAKTVKKRFVIAICAFGNSRAGGFVYVGINAEGKIVGQTYSAIFQIMLTHLLIIYEIQCHYIQNKSFVVGKIKINFTKRHDKTICMIQILPSDDM